MGTVPNFNKMTEIKDKLKYLKKERETRSKTQKIQAAWEAIDHTEDLSTKEKLEHLINLTRTKKAEAKIPQFESQEREQLKFIENPYPLDVRYGKIKIADGLDVSGDILSCLSKNPEFESLDLSTALFIDLETTGLSGGTGVIPFLIGLGYYREKKFYVAQYFLGDPGAEEQMIKEFNQLVADMKFKSIVSYNGRVFDLPLLETRFILKRQPFILSELPHLDFLFPARSLWAHKLENCRLHNLALEVIETGDGNPDYSSREQWYDGANVFAISPRRVISYDRNKFTNRALKEAGVEVIETSSSELSRGLGGPRCMTMPLQRMH